MYSRIRIDILGFVKDYEGTIRGDWAKPLLLLTDLNIFEQHKVNQTQEYLMINELIIEMQKQFERREPNVHRFDNTVFELGMVGMKPNNNLHFSHNHQFEFIISLMKQFCNFTYDYYDEYFEEKKPQEIIRNKNPDKSKL